MGNFFVAFSENLSFTILYLHYLFQFKNPVLFYYFYFIHLFQVSAPDHFGYCEVTPSEEISEGFYNFSAAQLKAFSERFKGQESIDGLFELLLEILTFWLFFRIILKTNF